MLELASRQELNERAGQYVKIAKSSGQMLLKLVEDLLDFETVSSGKANLVSETFSLTALYDKAIAPLESEAVRKGLLFDYASTADKAYFGDLNRIGQIVSNVLGNAVKFTDTGKVSVCLSKETDGPGLCIEVRDTGIGMPQDFISEAFDRFTQSDGSATRNHEGVGLGLSISKSLIDAMGGSISLSSEVGQGTAVKICLPLEMVSGRDAVSDAVSIAGSNLDVPTRPARILVAEDNQMNRDTIAAMLEEGGFELVFVHDGAAALQRMYEEPFDLLILDIQMPEKSGDEVLKEFRQAQRAKDIEPTPAIAFTANAYTTQQEHYREVGFDAVITKPIDIDRLEAEVARLIAA